VPTRYAGETEDGVARIFMAHGVPEADALLVASELVRTELMGIRSHGLIRVFQYLRDIASGLVRPGAPITILDGQGATAIVDCGWNLGIVAAHQALIAGIERAREHRLAAIVTRHCNHAGRLGSYAEVAARSGLICIAAIAIPELGHFVVPWGGAEGRLGTNPVAFGFPTDGDPIIADFATSVIPEGRIRAARAGGHELPPDAILDATGAPTTDPAAFYGPPRGFLLPFGGPVGYKGYALGLLAELLGGVLADTPVTATGRPVNGVFFLLLDPSAFLPPGRCEELAAEVVGYLHGTKAASGHQAVLVPGEREFSACEAAGTPAILDIDDSVWRDLSAAAEAAGVTLADRDPP
jgi:hydroxycarboxylate dehydrogenase B